MKKFNKLFNTDTTQVMLEGEYEFRKVIEIHETRNWIKVAGLEGSFQRGHIVEFTNKEPRKITREKYFADQYGSVYEPSNNCNNFIGKLNGRSLKQFVKDYEEQEIYSD